VGQKTDVCQGTLEVLGPLHGYGLARRIEQTSGDLLQLNLRCPLSGLAQARAGRLHPFSLGLSENNRKAKYCELTKAGPCAAKLLFCLRVRLYSLRKNSFV
jgi:PadR family transcriptional regulator PadR